MRTCLRITLAQFGVALGFECAGPAWFPERGDLVFMSTHDGDGEI